MSGLGVLALGVQFRRPATLLPYRGVLRVGARNRAGPLGSGGRTFSSGTSLASPSVRSSFVLRDVRHSKSQIGNDLNTERGTSWRLTSAVIPARSCRCPPRFGSTGTAGDLPKSRVVDCGPIAHSQQGAVVDHTRGRGVFFADLDRGCRFGGRVAAGIPTGGMVGRQPR